MTGVCKDETAVEQKEQTIKPFFDVPELMWDLFQSSPLSAKIPELLLKPGNNYAEGSTYTIAC